MDRKTYAKKKRASTRLAPLTKHTYIFLSIQFFIHIYFMTFEEALRVKIKDTLYTHDGSLICITGWTHKLDNPCLNDELYFFGLDENMKSVHFRYDHFCGPELCDEDKMFIEWYKNNSQNSEFMITYLKSAFMKGFQCGYSHKQRISCEDQLQK